MLVSTGSEPVRVQCAFIDTPEIEELTEFIGSQQGYPDALHLPEYIDDNEAGNQEIDLRKRDPMFDEAARLVVQHQPRHALLVDLTARRQYGARHRCQPIGCELARCRAAADPVDRCPRRSANLHAADVASLEEIRSAIREDTMLLEYYVADGTVYAALLGRNRFQVVPVAPATQVHQEFLLLDFQLSKFRLGEEYLRTFSELLRAATNDHLRALYRDLILPVRHLLQCRHVVIVPHGYLHRLPFHALFDGEQYLIDRYSISYAPSASVYYLCSRAQSKTGVGRSTVIGIPDPRTPHISEEVDGVAAQLPKPHILLGSEATVDHLRKVAANSRFVHVATHGEFRTDNPMFSAIRMADSSLNVYDLYDFRLSAELVTLSGCGTGLSVVTSGDELLGLVRGLLYSGTRAVLLTLWDVNDQSTADFMKSFYAKLATSPDKSDALKQAVHELRQSYPDVYHWAPFVLIGNSESRNPDKPRRKKRANSKNSHSSSRTRSTKQNFGK